MSDPSDRAQSDADQIENVGRNTSDRTQSDMDYQNTSSKLDELLSRDATPPAVPAVAISPSDQSSDRMQSDANQVDNKDQFDKMLANQNKMLANQADNTDQVINVERLDKLITGSNALAISAAEIVEATREGNAAVRTARKRFIIGTLLSILLTLSMLVPILVIGIRGEHQHKILLDCVTPKGQCLIDVQSRNKKAVDNVNMVAVLAAACAPDYINLPLPQRTVAITACIKKGLK